MVANTRPFLRKGILILGFVTSEEFQKQFGAHIKSLRKAKKISLREFALRCEMDKATLIRIESGESNARLSSLMTISEVLEIHVGELFSFIK